MSADRHSPDQADEAAVERRVNLIVWGALVAFFALLDLLIWLTERGGVLSVVTAASSVSDRRPTLDVDRDGLWLPAVVTTWVVVTGVSRMLNLRLSLSNRRSSLILAVLVLGGSFVLSHTLGQRIITRFMTAHGYSRCVQGDHAQGNGKSRVWFANYTLQAEDCRPSVSG